MVGEPKFEELWQKYKALGGEFKEFKKLNLKPEIGVEIKYEKKITEVDLHMFGLVSGDLQPLHFDEEYASKTRFKGRVAHGMLTTSLVSAPFAMLEGTVILLESHFKYLAPVRIGDTVLVKCVISEKDEKGRFKSNVECYVGEKKVVDGWVKFLVDSD